MTGQPRLHVEPIGLRAANAWVDRVHRHHGKARGHKFSLVAVDEDGQQRGVAIAGRPVARGLDDGLHLEVLRLATDGCPNACSFLYGAVARVAVAMGYPRCNVLTYILASEPGTSLVAAGWVVDGHVPGRSWSCPTRPRDDRHPLDDKVRWHAAPGHTPAPPPDPSLLDDMLDPPFDECAGGHPGSSYRDGDDVRCRRCGRVLNLATCPHDMAMDYCPTCSR